MVDDARSGGDPAPTICSWCSATYAGDPERCPSCGATLTGDAATDRSLPGLTAIDAAAIVRSRDPVKRPRNKLLSWISGEYPDQAPSASEAGALAPPDLAVRREILRLELEAEVANLQAEADAIRAEVIAEGAEPGAAPEDVAIAAQVAEDLATASDDLDESAAALEATPAEAPAVTAKDDTTA